MCINLNENVLLMTRLLLDENLRAGLDQAHSARQMSSGIVTIVAKFNLLQKYIITLFIVLFSILNIFRKGQNNYFRVKEKI